MSKFKTLLEASGMKELSLKEVENSKFLKFLYSFGMQMSGHFVKKTLSDDRGVVFKVSNEMLEMEKKFVGKAFVSSTFYGKKTSKSHRKLIDYMKSLGYNVSVLDRKFNSDEVDFDKNSDVLIFSRWGVKTGDILFFSKEAKKDFEELAEPVRSGHKKRLKDNRMIAVEFLEKTFPGIKIDRHEPLTRAVDDIFGYRCWSNSNRFYMNITVTVVDGKPKINFERVDGNVYQLPFGIAKKFFEL